MPYVEIDPHSVAVLQAISGEVAQQYIESVLLPSLKRAMHLHGDSVSEIREGFSNPYRCLLGFYGHYAFSRRGKDREELGSIANVALKNVADESHFDDLLSRADGSVLWDAFDAECRERHHKNPEQLNRGLIQGMVELAQEIYRIDRVGSITEWIAKGVRDTRFIEPQFLRIVDIRGVGPKNTSTFLRDVVFLYDLEEGLDHANRLYVQPIDRWIRMLATDIVTEIDAASAADWIIAGKIAKYARHAGVSGVRFNMGATYFGTRYVREAAYLEESLEELLSPNQDEPEAALGPPS